MLSSLTGCTSFAYVFLFGKEWFDDYLECSLITTCLGECSLPFFLINDDSVCLGDSCS